MTYLFWTHGDYCCATLRSFLAAYHRQHPELPAISVLATGVVTPNIAMETRRRVYATLIEITPGELWFGWNILSRKS